MAHIHSVYDTDLHFSINPKTRAIMNESKGKTVLIQGDHNSERCTFELPRLIDGHDMAKCNVVQVHYNNIDAITKASSRDVYEVDDLQVSPKDDNIVICSWLISRNATRYAGALGFVLRFACSSTGEIDYAWHTAVCSAISVSTGMDNTGIVVEEFSDVLEQWREQIFDGVDLKAREDIAALSADFKSAIVKKALADDADFNTVVEDGVYYAYVPNTQTNRPESGAGLLIVTEQKSVTTQDWVGIQTGARLARWALNGEWRDWQPVPLPDTVMQNHKALAEDADFDTIVEDGIYYAYTPNTQTNRPESGAGLLTVTTQKNVTTQDWVNIMTGVRYVRYAIDGAWKAWKNTIGDSVFVHRGTIASTADLNTLLENGIYYAASPNEHINSPVTSQAGIIIVTKQGVNTTCQVYISLMRGRVYARYRYKETWQPWKDGEQTDPAGVYYAFGDSTTYGQVAVTGGQSYYNYPACIGRKLNMTVKNKAVGGQGLLKDWDFIHSEYVDGLDMSDADLVSIGWAYNDGQSRYETLELGTAKDTGSDTFVGKYYTIMKEFQEKCPQAQIVLITGYGLMSDTYSQFKSGYYFADGKIHSMKEIYDLLEEMCHYNGWCCINQAKGSWITHYNWHTYIGDNIHPTSEGYVRYGSFMAARMAAIFANLKAW